MTFPAVWAPKPKQTTLAMLSGNTVITEHGETFTVNGWGGIRNAIEDNVTLFTRGKVTSGKWWSDCILDAGSPMFTQRAGIVGIRIQHKGNRRKTGYILDTSAWGGAQEVKSLRKCLETLNEGFQPSISSLGLAAMRTHYDRREEPIYRCSPSCEKAVTNAKVGGRVDTIRQNERLERVYELDLNAAYPAAAQSVPSGSAYAISEGSEEAGATSYRMCKVRATRNTDSPNMGPLPLRNGRYVIFPTEGEWEGWYWREEVDAAREAGFSVEKGYGWEWPTFTQGLKPWAEHMHRLRNENIAYPMVSGLLKLCSVAAIGRFSACGEWDEITEDVTELPYSDPTTGYLDPNGRPWAYYVRSTGRPQAHSAERLPHIGSYINAVVRLRVYTAAIREKDGLIATNYDAIYTLRKPDERENTTELGGWKWRELTNAIIEHPRWIESNEKVRRPGWNALSANSPRMPVFASA